MFMAIEATERSSIVKLATAVVVVGLLTWLCWERNALFRDDVTLYSATLEKNPDSWVLHNDLGSAYVHLKKIPEAIEEYQEALRLKSDYPSARFNLGAVYLDNDQTEKAIEQFLEAVRLRPFYPEAHLNLGAALVKTERYPEAIFHLRQALHQKPDYPEAHFHLGKALRNDPQSFSDALKEFEEAIACRPDWIDAHMQLAMTYSKMGKREKALAEAKKALDIAQQAGKQAAVQKIEAFLPTL